ncbi:cytochrome P450 94C1 [Phoenix dactylifera]|uniref:Cytochrome P450 94C1 n=1 Tax=Phoenix dactylifera TaxID=42345 RepID=A0A8B7CKP2_PHODC|nr:cytochrome P450 94C1 [Phoenix dactylifera]
MELEALESHLSLFLFSFTSIFLVFTLLLQLLRSRPWWCNCPVCEAYVTSSWRADFDNLSDWYTHLLRQSPTRTIHIHVLRNTITANPDNVEHMLKSRFDNYPKGKPFSSILGDFLGRGIFNVDGDLWRFQRMLASAELGSMSVRSFAFRIVSSEVCRRLLPLLDSAADTGQVLDFQNVFRRFAFDNICKISFGLDPGCLELSLPMSEFAAAFDTASRLSARRAAATVPAIWKAKRLLNSGSERELRRAIRVLDLLAEELICQRRKLGFSSSHDLLSRFMVSVDDDRYLRDIVVSFMLAGRDTVSSALTSFFMLLSRHPAAQSKIRSEIEQVTWSGGGGGGGGGGGASYDQLREMHYVRAALYESMRLYPPVQFNSKFSVDDDILPDGTFISRGTRVTYHAYAMGRMEELWGTDCGEFRPERWLKNGVFACENPFKYPVFQGGLRVCLGKEMALMEMKTVIASVVQGFDVDVIDGSRPPKFSPGLTAGLEGGLPVRVRRRKYKEGSTALPPELRPRSYYQYSYAGTC